MGLYPEWRNAKHPITMTERKGTGMREYSFLFHLKSLYLFFAPSLAVKMPDQEKMPPIWSHRAFAVLIIANLLVFLQSSIRALFSFRLVPCRILCHMSLHVSFSYKKANNQRQATCTDCVHRSKILEKERKKERDIMPGSDFISSLLNSHVLMQTAKSQRHKDSSHTWQRTDVSQLTFNPRKIEPRLVPNNPNTKLYTIRMDTNIFCRFCHQIFKFTLQNNLYFCLFIK